MRCIEGCKCALLCAPPCRLRCRRKTCDDANRHCATSTVQYSSVDAFTNRLAETCHNLRRQLRSCTVFEYRVRDGDIPTNHVSVQSNLREIEVKLVKRTCRLCPYRLRHFAHDILARCTAYPLQRDFAYKFAVGLDILAEDIEHYIRDS